MSNQCKPSRIPNHAIHMKRHVLPPSTVGDTTMVYPFSEDEYRKGLALLKTVLLGQLKNIGGCWQCSTNASWKKRSQPYGQSQNIAIRKAWERLCNSRATDQYPSCHTYKLYERMILNRITPTIELHLIKKQAGFRRGRSFTRKLLDITPHIQDGYQESMTTGTAFVDRYAAKDTLNHGLLIM